MPAALALLVTVFAVGFEQTIQWKYGAGGAVGLLLLTVGIKAKSPAVSSIGAVMLVALLTRPAA
ncbi:hypothetical protein ACFV0T_34900 [Streptomyces sp. NPDC059582]|uniref:hypothetical protein n=1 Tax=Streptomyces sp. NPDC059582 TaxID=3346875 RepID=UPI0036836AC1